MPANFTYGMILRIILSHAANGFDARQIHRWQDLWHNYPLPRRATKQLAVSREKSIRLQRRTACLQAFPWRRIWRVTTWASTVSLAAAMGAGVYFFLMYHICTIESTWLSVQ